jgi:sec-independent protein translocase protein TatC
VSDGSMGLLEHLDEFRRRLIVSLVAVVIGTVAALGFAGRIVDFIMRPLQQMLPSGGRLIFAEPMEAFLLHLRVAALAGVVLVAPVIFWQVWLFLAPRLRARERRLAIPFVLFSSTLFAGGAAFSHFVAFPWAWRFFAAFSTEFVAFLPRIEPVFSLYVRMLFAFGLTFQMPMLTLLLARAGVVTAGWLARRAKYAVLAIFIIAAVITPTPDPVGQTLMAAPMVVLYGVSVLVAWAFGPRPRGA